MIKQKIFLTAETILKFLTGKDEEIDTLIICRSSEFELMTTDQSLYEALGSIVERSNINYNKLIKFLEVVDVHSYAQKLNRPRKILTEERVSELRKGL